MGVKERDISYVERRHVRWPVTW